LVLGTGYTILASLRQGSVKRTNVAMNEKLPGAREIFDVASAAIERWHEREEDISSIKDALEKLGTNSTNRFVQIIEKLSIINTALWHEEDKTRDLEAADAMIARSKRLIDRLNAERVETVEMIDDQIVEAIALNGSAPLNTETPGSIIDRLTILCLKRYHMSYEAERESATEEHRSRCREKLLKIEEQMGDLMQAYDCFIHEMELGRRTFKLYRQFKMYNDPELNPLLYRKKGKR
jgi:hypothetical protein